MMGALSRRTSHDAYCSCFGSVPQTSKARGIAALSRLDVTVSVPSAELRSKKPHRRKSMRRCNDFFVVAKSPAGIEDGSRSVAPLPAKVFVEDFSD